MSLLEQKIIILKNVRVNIGMIKPQFNKASIALFNFIIDNGSSTEELMSFGVFWGFIILLVVPFCTDTLLNVYLTYNYYVYFSVLCLLIFIFIPLWVVISSPLLIVCNFIGHYILKLRVRFISANKLRDMILQFISSHKIRAIYPHHLAKILLLPEENIKAALNLLVVEGKADFAVSENGRIFYSFSTSLDEIVQRITRRILDAN